MKNAHKMTLKQFILAKLGELGQMITTKRFVAFVWVVLLVLVLLMLLAQQ